MSAPLPPFPELSMLPESLRQQVWATVVADLQQQRGMAKQRPHSNAYRAGAAPSLGKSKDSALQRRLMTNPSIWLQECIVKAAKNAGATPVGLDASASNDAKRAAALEVIMAREGTLLPDFTEVLREAARERVLDDPDFDWERYTETARVLGVGLGQDA